MTIETVDRSLLRYTKGIEHTKNDRLPVGVNLFFSNDFNDLATLDQFLEQFQQVKSPKKTKKKALTNLKMAVYWWGWRCQGSVAKKKGSRTCGW